MKNMKKALSIFVFSLLFGVLFISIVSLSTPQVMAAGLSVTKAVMEYKNVLRGGYAEDSVYIASDTDFDVPLEYEVLGDIADWISFEPAINETNSTLYVSKTHAQQLKIIIQPPIDAASGNYSGGVRIITGTINRPEGPYGSQLQAAFLIKISVSVTGEQMLSCNFGGLNVPDVEIGEPITYSFSVQNSGNVRVRPNISIDLWNQDQSRLVKSILDDYAADVLPTTSRVFSGESPNNLRIGQYWAYASVAPCGNSEIVSFSVLEKGQIADLGELIRIENKPWASTGEIVPITAIFKNNGARVVSAKFKGIITMNNKIVQNLDSDFYDIPPGELTNITVFFTPKSLGQYYISGRVLYNNKLTFEKSSILNVNTGENITDMNMLYVVLIIVILIIILILLIMIKKRKQRGKRF
jgi:hypothetical protein